MKTIVSAPSANADRLLKPVTGFYLSSMLLFIKVLDEDISAVNVRVYKLTDMESDNPNPYTVAATLQEDGLYRAYLQGACFQDVSNTLKYQIVAIDTEGNMRSLGFGPLRVLRSDLTEGGIAPSILPNDLYAYNSTTGLWHKITASLDDAGIISLDIEQEGVVR